MKLFALIFSLFLIGCSSSPKLSFQEKMLAAYPVSLNSEDFKFSELLLITKIDHHEKQVEKCRGLLPGTKERQIINNLYFEQKINKEVKFEKSLILSLADKNHEYVLFNLHGDDSTLESAVSACTRLVIFYTQDGYKVLSP